MIEANNHIIMNDVQEIVLELRKQLSLNGIERFSKFIDSGENLMTCCPFHKDGQEKKPSFGIHKKDGTCHCFGCGWAGSLQEMISNCFGHDDFGNFGSKWLVKNFLTVSVSERPELDLELSRGKNIQSQKYIEDAVLDKYRVYHPYMWKRKLTPDVVDLFDIGYDEESQCITFPIRDVHGNCLFVARRSVNTKFFNYPASVEKPVYGLYELREISRFEYKEKTVDGCTVTQHLEDYPKEVIICESMIDALTCWVYGKYAVALNGLGNDLQFKQLNAMPCRKFILATDMDEAGLRARQRIKTKLKGKIVTEYKWELSVAKDINDMTEDYFNSLKEIF